MASKKKWKAPFGLEGFNWIAGEGYHNVRPCLLHSVYKGSNTYSIGFLAPHLQHLFVSKSQWTGDPELPVDWRDPDDFEATMQITNNRIWTRTHDLVKIIDQKDGCLYPISTFELMPIMIKYGVLPGGFLPNLTWQIKNKGGYISIKLAEDNE